MQMEAIEQETLFEWSAYMADDYPELSHMFHIPNGGKRNAREAAHLRRQGVKAGVPDIFLPAARGPHHGLFIELKAGNNKPTALQKSWLQGLSELGYKAVVCYGWQAAADEIINYLTQKEKTK